MKNMIYIVLCISICLTSCGDQNLNSYPKYINNTEINEMDRLLNCYVAYELAFNQDVRKIYNPPKIIDKYTPQNKFKINFLGYMFITDLAINNLSYSDAENHFRSMMNLDNNNLMQNIKSITNSNMTHNQKKKQFEYIIDNTILQCIRDYDAAKELNIQNRWGPQSKSANPYK